MLASTAWPSPIEQLTTEFGEFAAKMVGRIVVVEGGEAGHLELAQVWLRAKLIGAKWEARIVVHVLDDFDDGLIGCLLEEALLVITTHLPIVGCETAEKN